MSAINITYLLMAIYAQIDRWYIYLVSLYIALQLMLVRYRRISVLLQVLQALRVKIALSTPKEKIQFLS